MVAPGDGMLRVEVNWVPEKGAEGVALLIAGVRPHSDTILSQKVIAQRVLAGGTYGITVVYNPSHFDFIVLGPNLIGRFALKATFEK